MDNRNLELINWIVSLEDSSMLDEILIFKSVIDEDMWTETSEDEKKFINLGLKDAEARKLKPHSEARKLYEKWL